MSCSCSSVRLSAGVPRTALAWGCTSSGSLANSRPTVSLTISWSPPVGCSAASSSSLSVTAAVARTHAFHRQEHRSDQPVVLISRQISIGGLKHLIARVLLHKKFFPVLVIVECLYYVSAVFPGPFAFEVFLPIPVAVDVP